MELIIATVIGIFVFISTVLAFGLGIKYGMAIKKGVQPHLEGLQTIKAVIRPKKEKDKTSADENNIKNLMGYKGEVK